MAVLHEVGLESGRPVDSVLTGTDGEYTLRSPGRDTTAGYLVSVQHHGVGYFSEPFVSSDAPVIEAATVTAYDTSSTSPDIAVLQRHIIVRAPGADGSRRVLELIELSNDGFTTRITADSMLPVWQGAIPSGALFFEVGQGDLNPQLVSRRGDSVAVTAPIPPGSKQILVTYLLPESISSLRIPVDQRVQDMNIMFEDTNATIVEGPFALAGIETLEQVSLFRYNAVEILPGTRVTVRFAGTAFTLLQLWWVIVPVAALTMGGALYWWLKHQPTATTVTTTAAESKSEQLARQIAQLDQEHEANQANMSEAERAAYRSKRSDLKARLSAMLAEERKQS